jgi:phage I-like protein
MLVVPAPESDGKVKGADGRQFPFNASTVAAAFTAPIPVDENHSTELAAPFGMPSPALGWINALIANPDGSLLADVTWSEKGALAVTTLEYRFLSPVFEVGEAREVLRLLSVGLTNSPNFTSLALNNQQNPTENPMNKTLLAVLAALALSETATEAEALAEIERLKKAAAAAKPADLNQFVPRADYDVLLNRAQTAETQIKSAAAAAHQGAVELALNAALEAKKITPATADYHRQCCATSEGLALFKKFVGDSPVLVPDTALPNSPPGEVKALNAEQKQLAKSLGISDEAYLQSLQAA